MNKPCHINDWITICKKKKIKKLTIKKFIENWIEWRISTVQIFKDIATYSETANYIIKNNLRMLIQDHIQELQMKWQLDDNVLLILIKKLNPINTNIYLNITHENFTIILRKLMYYNLIYLSKRSFPKLIANNIASFIPMTFPKKERYRDIIDNNHCWVDIGITFNIWPIDDNFTNDIWMQIDHKKMETCFVEEKFEQYYEIIDKSIKKR